MVTRIELANQTIFVGFPVFVARLVEIRPLMVGLILKDMWSF